MIYTKCRTEKNTPTKNTPSARLSFRSEGVIKSFSDKEVSETHYR